MRPECADLNDQYDPPVEREIAAKRRQLEAARTALEHFNESIGRLAQTAEADDPRAPSTLLVWLNVNLDMRMCRFDDRTGRSSLPMSGYASRPAVDRIREQFRRLGHGG